MPTMGEVIRTGLVFCDLCFETKCLHEEAILSRDWLFLARNVAFLLPLFLCVRTRDTLNILLEWGNPLKSSPTLKSVCPCHVMFAWLCHCGCLNTKWLSRNKRFKFAFKQSKLLVKWHYERRNSSPGRYKFKKSWDKNKNHTFSVFCSTRVSGFLLGDFFRGSGWTEYHTRCFLSSFLCIVHPKYTANTNITELKCIQICNCTSSVCHMWDRLFETKPIKI